MRAGCKIFLLSVFLSGIIVPGFCGVGNTDDRVYIDADKWATAPYKNFVLIRPCVNLENQIYCSSICTAQYIAPNLILSAAHCLENLADFYNITRYNDTEKLGVQAIEKVLDSGDYDEVDDVGDWAIFKIHDATKYHNFYSNSFFDVKEPNKTTSVINAGFGWARVLTDKELNKIRELSQNIKNLPGEDFFKELELRMQKAGMKPLREENPKLKVSECEITFEGKGVKEFPDIIKTTCDAWGGNSGGGYISEDGKYLYGVVSYGQPGYYNFTNTDASYMTSARQFFNDVQKYKSQYSVSSYSTQVSPKKSEEPYTPIKVEPKSGGISAPTMQDMNASIAGIKIPNLTSGIKGPVSTEPNIAGTELIDVGASGALNWTPGEIPTGAVNVSPSNNTIEEHSGETNLLAAVSTGVIGASGGNINANLEKKQKEINELQADVSDKIPNVSNMSDKDLLKLLNNLVTLDVKKQDLEVLKQLQKKYEEAKGKEQSKANRLLTAATVAATGIGGMELAQGLAEQKADKEAAADMAAYINTMRCTYGKGKSVKAGSEEIELPGGNSDELMKLRNEYFALAADLKARKEALGMKPGIESEEILDKAQLDLYSQENVGITDGAYASLYRSQMLGSEKDKSQIDEDAKKSKNRVIGGGVAAGVGVIGGAVGDVLINGEK